MDSTYPRWTDADMEHARQRAFEQGVQTERARLLLLTGEMLEAWDANARRAYVADRERRRAANAANPPAPVRDVDGWPTVTQPGAGSK